MSCTAQVQMFAKNMSVLNAANWMSRGYFQL